MGNRKAPKVVKAEMVKAIPAPPPTVLSGNAGRPSILSDELQEAIVADVRRGLTYDDAAALNGIGRSTFHDWFKQGRDGVSERLVAFATAVTRARSEARRDAVANVRAGVMMNLTPDWKAEAWWLERMYPQEYGPQAAVHVKVVKELEAMLDKLKEKLAPDIYDMVLGAIASDDRGEAPSGQ